MTETALLVFAKTPVEGEVKTRIGKKIGMRTSKWVYEQLLHHTGQISKKSRLQTVVFNNKVLKEQPPYFPHTVSHHVQKGKHLGEKMEAAFAWAFDQGYEKVLLIGSDLWSLHENTLMEAEQALDLNDFVIGPSYDGGYYLLGMKKMNTKIFNEVPWSTPQVFKKTLLNIPKNSIHYLEIANDIDELEDLKANPSLFNRYQNQFTKNC